MLYKYECMKCHKQIEELQEGWGSRVKRAICPACTRRLLRERAGTWTAFVVGSLFLCSLPLWAKVPGAKLQQTDAMVGKAAFRIQRHGDDILMQPMLTPRFQLSYIKGPRPVDGDPAIQQCSVWSRELRRSYEDMTLITVTVLKCGETEYGMRGVDFQFEDSKK